MRLRVGIVGLGSQWESRHLPALRSLADRFEVRGICDGLEKIMPADLYPLPTYAEMLFSTR